MARLMATIFSFDMQQSLHAITSYCFLTIHSANKNNVRDLVNEAQVRFIRLITMFLSKFDRKLVIYSPVHIPAIALITQ